MLPRQILWIHLVTGGLPKTGLAGDLPCDLAGELAETVDWRVMEHWRLPRNGAFIDRSFVVTMILTALLTAGLAVGV